jgi:hypothetical protein
VQRDTAEGGIHPAGQGALPVRGVAAQLDQAFQLPGKAVVHPVRHHVDDAAGRARAVQQCRRAPDDLDLVGQRRVDRHGVVLGQAGGIERCQAVRQDLDPVAAEAADHRARGAGAEESRMHSGFAGDGLAERRGESQGELRARDHADRLGRARQRLGQRRRRDQDFLEFAVRISGPCGARRRQRKAGTSREKDPGFHDTPSG